MAKLESTAPIAITRAKKVLPPEVEAAMKALEEAKTHAADRIKKEKVAKLQEKAKALNDKLDKIDAELALLQ